MLKDDAHLSKKSDSVKIVQEKNDTQNEIDVAIDVDMTDIHNLAKLIEPAAGLVIEEEQSPRGSINSLNSHGENEGESNGLEKARQMAMINGPSTQVRGEKSSFDFGGQAAEPIVEDNDDSKHQSSVSGKMQVGGDENSDVASLINSVIAASPLIKANKSEGDCQSSEKEAAVPQAEESSESGDAEVGGDDEGSSVQSMPDVIAAPVREDVVVAPVHEDEPPADENDDKSSASGEAEVGGGDDNSSVQSIPLSL